MVKIELIEDINDSRLSCWNEVLDTASCPLPFQRFEWVSCWQKIFAPDEKGLFILVASEDNKAVGIAPFTRRKMPLGYESVVFMGSGYFDYFDFIITKGREREVIRAFLDYIKGYFHSFELRLSNIFGSSEAFKVLRDIFALRDYEGIILKEDVVPIIELPAGKDEFYRRTDRLLRSDVARRERRLKELGETEFRRCAGLNEAKGLLEDFFELHIKKWEGAKGYSAYKFLPRRRLLRDLLEMWFNEGLANVYYLLHDKTRKAAICFGFEFKGKFYFYTHAYDPDFSKCSPAKILVGKLIELSIENKFKEFDFGIGSEPYKLEWPCVIRELHNIFVYSGRNKFIDIFLKRRRRIAGFYYLFILPRLRRLKAAVSFWRWINKKKGSYRRFE